LTAQPIETPTSTDLVDPNGRTWHASGRTRDGEPLYFIDGAPATCPTFVMSTEAELTESFGAPMTPAGGAA
jgi:hypothetical protein